MVYRLIRSRRKTLGIEIVSPEEMLLRAPLRMPESEIRRFVEEKQDWIRKSLAKAARREAERKALPKLTEADLRLLAQQAKQILPKRVAERAAEAGVRYGRITVRSQRTRWGSCSAKGNLNFNCLLMLCPDEVIDYVVVHELCHRKEMNHSARFWAEVEKLLPGYREPRKWLKTNGAAILGRIRD